MIMLKSTHEAMMQLQKQQIDALKDEVRYLRNWLQPRGTVESVKNSLEADALLSGHQEQIKMYVTDSATEDARSERDRLLSGNY